MTRLAALQILVVLMQPIPGALHCQMLMVMHVDPQQVRHGGEQSERAVQTVELVVQASM